ncbi:MADS-box transcription factor PHERES 2-like [Solanum stenotomum]|uniref:MADS-box transcription factor PHERES 2-like n=1 Tax=Solanum stenotomum TaxID=172797 RepID=UPI0020D050D7|nr:MADS-box transcription factor PHERES 2-like [Solanum stenotomum]
MTRNKVNYAFIEDDSKRKISYNKRLKGLLKKSDELKTLCDVEVATVIYGRYRNEPYTFPNNDVVRNTFIKFKELPTLDRSKNMVTREEFTMQRIKKLEEQLQKVIKENRVKEMTNEMYAVFERKTVLVDMNPSYLNDLSCVIKKNLKQVRELMIKEANGEGSTSNAPQPIVEPMVPSRNNSEGPMDPSPLLFSQMFPPMVPQFFSPMPQDMTVGKTPGLTHPMPSTIMYSPISSTTMNSIMPSPMNDSPMPSLMIAPPMYSPVSPTMNQQMELSMDIPSIGISTPMNNNQNSSVDLLDSPTISGFLNRKDDVVMTLLDDPFFKNNNVQDPSHTKKF